MHPTKRPRTSKIHTLKSNLQQRLEQLQASNLTLTQLSQETDTFLALVKDFRSARAQRQLLVKRIEVALAQVCGELQACEQDQVRCSLRDRLKLVQEMVRGHCQPVVKSEHLSETEARTDLSFISPTSHN